MNLSGRLPQPKPQPVKRDPAYLAAVHRLPCAVCGVHGVEAHHCKDRPEHGEQGLYQRLPGMSQKSGDRDAIPLCPEHHRLFHLERATFHQFYGPDYGYIPPTRAAVSDGEVDF